MRICLASASPRRRELMKKITQHFEVFSPNVDERSFSVPSARDECVVLSQIKARAAAEKLTDCAVVAADTIVLADGEKLNKPRDEAEALRMLSLLSGRTHEVATGVTVICGDKEISRLCVTEVTFRSLGEREIAEYVRRFRPLDKAGAYGIQDDFPLAERISGSYENVVGLDTETVREMLKELGAL